MEGFRKLLETCQNARNDDKADLQKRGIRGSNQGNDRRKEEIWKPQLGASKHHKEVMSAKCVCITLKVFLHENPDLLYEIKRSVGIYFLTKPLR